MSTEFENSSVDLEQLLRTKSWEQLTEDEKSEMNKILSGKEEYTRMYAMTNQLMAGSGVHDDDLKPSEELRENLMNAFAVEQRKRRAAWWSSLWYGLSDKLRFDIPMVRIAVAAVLLIAGIFGVSKMMDNNEQPVIVKNQPMNTTQPFTPEGGAAENNVVEQATNNGPVVSPEENEANASHENSNSPQVVLLNPDLNPNAGQNLDTAQYITAFTNNGQPLIVDSNILVLPTATFNMTNANCCATSNGTVLNATGAATYQWTSTNNVTVNGLPTRARSLENDSEVLDVFFAVK